MQIEETRKKVVNEVADLEMRVEMLRFEVKQATAVKDEYRALEKLLKWKQEEVVEANGNTEGL